MHEGWAVRVKGDRIEAAGPASEMAAAGRDGDRSAWRDAAARPGRGALARAVASVRRDAVERSGAQGVARPANGASGDPSARHAARRLHDHPRSRHRGRGLRGRGAQAGSQRRDHSRAANAGVDARNRGDRQLRPERVLARMARAAGRRRGRRRRAHPRRARPDRPWRRLDQGLRGLLAGGRVARPCRRSRWTSSS